MRILKTLVLLAGLPGMVLAGDFYVTPTGQGRLDGADWANAAPQGKLQAFLSNDVKPGDSVRLGSGVYKKLPHTNGTFLIVARGGTKEQPVNIMGVDTGEGLPRIEGRWSEKNIHYHAHSSSALVLAKGVSHVRIGKLGIANCMHGIAATGGNDDIEIADLTIERCREAITLVGLTQSQIRNCRFTQYTKRGIRFDKGCHDLVISDVVADATGGVETWPIEPFPFGFAVEDGAGNHTIRYERCTARHNFCRGEPDKYWNGDGFLAESPTEKISYYDCRSFDNADGGWDDKSRAPLLVRCVSGRNKRGFRIWNARGDAEHPAQLQSCLSVFNKVPGGRGSSAGLWLCGFVEADHCTFHDNATAAVSIDKHDRAAGLVAKNCIFSVDQSVRVDALVHKAEGITYTPVAVAEWIEGVSGDDPQFVAPSSTWLGDPADAFNSRRYGKDRGYWFKPAQSPSLPPAP